MFCALLFITEQFSSYRLILRESGATVTGPCNGTGINHPATLAVVFHLYLQLGGRANNLKIAHIEIVEIGRGVDGAEHPVHIKRPGIEFPAKPLRNLYLKNVACENMFFGYGNLCKVLILVVLDTTGSGASGRKSICSLWSGL